MQQPVLVFQVCAYRLVTDYYGEVEGQRGVTVGLMRHWWRRHNRMEGKRKNSRDKHREHSEAVRVRQTAYKHKPSEWGARGASCFIYELICTGGGLVVVEGCSDRPYFLHPGQTSGATYIEERGFKGLHGGAVLPALLLPVPGARLGVALAVGGSVAGIRVSGPWGRGAARRRGERRARLVP